MPERQEEDIDALLAEVNALADEAVAEIVGQEPAGDTFDADVPFSPVTEPLSPVTEPLAAHSAPTPPADPAPASALTTKVEDLDRILRLQVPVIVQLACRTMPLSEIITLSTGAIIEFEKLADSDLDLVINNKCIGQGQAVKVSENFGLRVTHIGSLRARIRALGK